jgi:transposase InsO family protein
MEMDNVLHVDGIKKRFLSTDRLVRKGFRISFANAGAEIRHSSNQFCTVGIRNGPYYWHHLYPRNPDVANLNAVENLPIQIWHERMGHLNWDAIKRVRKEDSPLLGIKLDSSEPHGTCEGCIAGKEKRRTFRSSSNCTSEPLEIIHSDLAGPMESVSIGGNRYFVIFLDGATSHVWVVFMKTKDQTLGVFKTFTAMIQKLTGRNVKIFRSDCGGEFMSEEFSKFLENSGISRETSAPRTPQQNGFAERMMRTLVGSARAMLQHAGLSKGFWSEAVAAAAHIHNRSPRRGLGWKTPHELLRGRTPDISYLRVFGCRAWVYTPKDQRKKWDANSQPMIFVGYEPGSKSYRLWNPRTRSIVISASVRFDETYFPRKPVQDPPVIMQGSPVEQSVQISLLIEDEPPVPQPVAPVQPTMALPTPAATFLFPTRPPLLLSPLLLLLFPSSPLHCPNRPRRRLSLLPYPMTRGHPIQDHLAPNRSPRYRCRKRLRNGKMMVRAPLRRRENRKRRRRQTAHLLPESPYEKPSRSKDIRPEHPRSPGMTPS